MVVAHCFIRGFQTQHVDRSRAIVALAATPLMLHLAERNIYARRASFTCLCFCFLCRWLTMRDGLTNEGDGLCNSFVDFALGVAGGTDLFGPCCSFFVDAAVNERRSQDLVVRYVSFTGFARSM